MSLSSTSNVVAHPSGPTAVTTISNAETGPRMMARSELRIQAFRPVETCSRVCLCNCHKIRRMRLPEKTALIFGRGTFAFRGVQFRRTRCNLRSCKQGAGLAVRINYFLLTWLSQRMISAWFISTPLCGPKLLLKIYRVVDFRKDPLVKAVTCGRLEDLQTLLATGTISPYIINQYGHSLLHVCQSSYKLSNLRPLLTTTCTDSFSRCSHQLCHSTITSRDGVRSKLYYTDNTGE